MPFRPSPCSMRTAFLISALLLPLAACDTTGTDNGYERIGTFEIDPQGTYLRTNQDLANAPTAIDLAGLGVVPGDSIYVRILGEADLDPASASGGQPGASSFTVAGVFSTSSTLLASDQLDRVAGAIDVGPDIETAPTAIGALPTDIREDALINRTGFRVPAAATTLFLNVVDRFYSDNAAETFTATVTRKENL